MVQLKSVPKPVTEAAGPQRPRPAPEPVRSRMVLAGSPKGPCCTDRYGWPRGAPSAQEAGTGASGTVCVPPR